VGVGRKNKKYVRNSMMDFFEKRKTRGKGGGTRFK